MRASLAHQASTPLKVCHKSHWRSKPLKFSSNLFFLHFFIVWKRDDEKFWYFETKTKTLNYYKSIFSVILTFSKFLYQKTRGMGHYMAKKTAFIIKLPLPYPLNYPVLGYFMLVSFPCVTVKQMLVLVFCVLLVTHGGFIMETD